MVNDESEEAGMHLRGVYGSQTDFDVDEYRESTDDEADE